MVEANAKRTVPLATDPRGPISVMFLLFVVVVSAGVMQKLTNQCYQEHTGQPFEGLGCKDPILEAIFSGKTLVSMMTDGPEQLLKTVFIASPVAACLIAACYFGFCEAMHKGRPMLEVLMYQGIGGVTGILAGLLGIGGGLIFSPFFLLVGIEPAVAVATSSTCVIFTSSSTTFQYLFTNRIIVSLALVYGGVGIIASYVGTALVHKLQAEARPSYISGIVTLGVGLSAVLSLYKSWQILT